jgi:hypothetical protein
VQIRVGRCGGEILIDPQEEVFRKP